jgi:RNA polymerase sigma-70 factor (ECF subfamily)
MSSGFPVTHWSRLVGLRTEAEADRTEALSWFAHHYWRPVYHYIRALRRGSADESEDLTQQFFADLIEHDRLSALSPDRGSVRGFLKVALRNFVANQRRAESARQRRFPIDEAHAEIAEDPSLGPDEAFDRAWVKQILTEAVSHLRRQLEAEGRARQYEVFDAYCLHQDDVTYEEVAGRLGMKAEDARNRVRDSRRRLVDILREMVREYLGPGEDVDREIAFVLGDGE